MRSVGIPLRPGVPVWCDEPEPEGREDPDGREEPEEDDGPGDDEEPVTKSDQHSRPHSIPTEAGARAESVEDEKNQTKDAKM